MITENFSTVPNAGAVPDVTSDVLVGETTNGVRHFLPVAEAPPPAAATHPPADTVSPHNADNCIDRVEKKDKAELAKTYIKHRPGLNPPYHCAYMKTYKSSCGKSFKTIDEALAHVGSHLKNVIKTCRLCGQCFTKAEYAKKHIKLGRCRPSSSVARPPTPPPKPKPTVKFIPSPPKPRSIPLVKTPVVTREPAPETSLQVPWLDMPNLYGNESFED
ncbi:hypothetical protein M422DRAFT_275850 [Sphaerobolus stellatus SS14]|uniref:C2H2-type domain-containing protein n=1 Tax=Sphaerobolus stellatus (strain SS14) TaxID=990650 RepID=A0A0C9U387_SPHS4|nr:hypothetical protein M422DRAFT_275850 [Sphaerobolus stellatus SS14]